MSLRRLTLVLLPLALVGGCSANQIRELRAAITRHEVVVLNETIGVVRAEAAPVGSPLAVDLLLADYAGDAAPFLDAFATALDRHPGVKVRRITARGASASRAPRRRSDARPDVHVVLTCRAAFEGRVSNAFVAFPGMIPLLPLVLGFRYDLVLDVSASVRSDDEPIRRAGSARRIEVAFREKCPPRSRFFNFWPSTGTLGTQFVAGLVLAPFMIPYDGEDSTRALVVALGSRLPRRVANDVAALARQVTDTRR